MLPGKIGAARKLCVLLEKLKAVTEIPSSDAEQSSLQIHPTTVAVLTSPLSETEEPAANVTAVPSLNQPDLTVAASTATTLPKYSQRIQDVLSKGQVLIDLDRFIEETAYHIISI